MLKKLFLIPLMTILMLFNSILSAEAYINSQEELHNSILKLYELRNFDSLSLINKNELIGERLANFNEARFTYNSALEASLHQLLLYEDELYELYKSEDANQQFIDIQVQRIYHDANSVVANVNNQAGDFLKNIRHIMPTVTYQKFRKKFYDYYQSVELIK